MVSYIGCWTCCGSCCCGSCGPLEPSPCLASVIDAFIPATASAEEDVEEGVAEMEEGSSSLSSLSRVPVGGE